MSGVSPTLWMVTFSDQLLFSGFALGEEMRQVSHSSQPSGPNLPFRGQSRIPGCTRVEQRGSRKGCSVNAWQAQQSRVLVRCPL